MVYLNLNSEIATPFHQSSLSDIGRSFYLTPNYLLPTITAISTVQVSYGNPLDALDTNEYAPSTPVNVLNHVRY